MSTYPDTVRPGCRSRPSSGWPAACGPTRKTPNPPSNIPRKRDKSRETAGFFPDSLLDEGPAAGELREGLMPAPASSDSGLSPDARRILEAIEGLPEGEREAFDLVKIQGMTQAEAAQVLGVSVRTVKRWVDRSLRQLTAKLGG